jgi:hypothetical protein
MSYNYDLLHLEFENACIDKSVISESLENINLGYPFSVFELEAVLHIAHTAVFRRVPTPETV